MTEKYDSGDVHAGELKKQQNSHEEKFESISH
jgi:hypothetical protein